ncbi:MAG TPA: family 20 glycosylhydrolase [Bacteroidota bacterium]|nr:family 20 glycosylhydrolase [Bacteroidota bacterium]
MTRRTIFPLLALPLASLCITLAVPASASDARGVLPLVPLPDSIALRNGSFRIDVRTSIQVSSTSPNLNEIGRFLAARLRASTGYPLPLDTAVVFKPGALPPNVIMLSLPDPGGSWRNGAYELIVAKDRIDILAPSPAGAFYALQTLFQLLPVEFEYGSPVYGVNWEVPCVEIRDAPRFSWRGMHLDVGRHFFGKKFVEEYIDLISRYKFNVFHWHLTDDQGWRIEIKKYPKLTTVGAWRKETMGDGQPHGGYYTQDEIREVVAYAKERFVTIVPEIEMPGHSTAALASYPELSCTGGPFDVQTKWRVFDDVYCAGNEKTFAFLEDVLAEVIPLFPGEYVHIGGDECPKTRWKVCPLCQARMKAEGLATEHELQSYFVRRIEKFLNARGKRLIGWDEILEGGLAPNATVMSWRGIDGGIAAAMSGHDVVMTPTSNCYFDYRQGLTGEPEPVGALLALDQVYAYEPVPGALTAEQALHILGAQGNVWTEQIPDKRKVEYMAFPRACAMSEVVWSPAGKKNFQDFSARMAGQYARLVARGVNVRIPPPAGFEGTYLLFGDTSVTIKSQVPGSILRYTTDGTLPTLDSRDVTEPVPVRESMTIKGRAFLPGGGMSPVPVGVYSIVDKEINGVACRIAPKRASAARADTLRGVTYRMSLEGLPLSADSATVILDSYFTTREEGVYTFTIAQGDSTVLAIDGSPAVNNRAADWWDLPAGRFHLRSGPHAISVMVAASGHGPALDITVQGPGLEAQQIPASMLSRRPH